MDGVAQGVDPEFKPKYHKKEKKESSNHEFERQWRPSKCLTVDNDKCNLSFIDWL
jgi:hypothetical protein